jgi:hypothetical protein
MVDRDEDHLSRQDRGQAGILETRAGGLFAAEWDLLLCSAGSLSAVICEAARQRGRKAIDVGACDVAIRKDCRRGGSSDFD